MVFSTPYLFGVSTMELPISKFANYAYTWHQLCKPPKRTFTSSTSQWLLFLFHSFQIYIFLKQITPTPSSSIVCTMHICIEGWMPLSRNISSDKFLNDDNDIALPPISVPILISVCLPTPPPKTPVSKPKLVMTPEEYQSLIYNLLNEPITFPPEYPIKEKLVS